MVQRKVDLLLKLLERLAVSFEEIGTSCPRLIHNLAVFPLRKTLEALFSQPLRPLFLYMEESLHLLFIVN